MSEHTRVHVRVQKQVVFIININKLPFGTAKLRYLPLIGKVICQRGLIEHDLKWPDFTQKVIRGQIQSCLNKNHFHIVHLWGSHRLIFLDNLSSSQLLFWKSVICWSFQCHHKVIIRSFRVNLTLEFRRLIFDEFELQNHWYYTNVFVKGLPKEDQESFEYH